MPADNELYDRLGDTWWDENQAFNLLRSMLNPGRFGYCQEVLSERLKIDPRGKAALDVGCGGGLLAEEFARLGWRITGIDPSNASIETAKAHARLSELDIRYQVGVGENIPFAGASFELVYCCDVLEHVSDLERVIAEIARVLKPGGIFLYDTINRTLMSNLGLIKLIQEWQSTSVMPPNLHDWHMFIRPRELQAIMQRYGLPNREIVGLKPDAHPLALISLLRKRKQGKVTFHELSKRVKFRQSRDTSMLYMGYAIKE